MTNLYRGVDLVVDGPLESCSNSNTTKKPPEGNDDSSLYSANFLTRECITHQNKLNLINCLIWLLTLLKHCRGRSGWKTDGWFVDMISTSLPELLPLNSRILCICFSSHSVSGPGTRCSLNLACLFAFESSKCTFRN